MKKKEIIPALTELINGYNSNTNDHSYSTCPLCIASGSCGDCINSVFDIGKSRTPCYQRCHDYTMLNYYDSKCAYKSTTNDQNLSMFWQEILKLIRSKWGRNIDIDELKPEILAIAEKYR